MESAQFKTITSTDSIYLYSIELWNINAFEELMGTVLAFLHHHQIELFDLHSMGSSSCGNLLIHGSFTAVTFSPIPDDVLKNLLEMSFLFEKYPSAKRSDSIITLSSPDVYSAEELKIQLSLENHHCGTADCGCNIHEKVSYPLVGLYRGEYFDVGKVLAHNSKHPGIFGRYHDVEYAASWNFKSDPAIDSIKQLTTEKVRDAGLILASDTAEYKKSIWSLGFGW